MRALHTHLFSSLLAIVRKHNFNPGLFGIFVNPFYFARKGLYDHIKSFAPSIKGKTLDIGCGSKPYKRLFDVPEYIGLEIESASETKHIFADYLYNGSTFPFPNEFFDSVVTFQVFEHVFNPEEFLSELYRVLKTEGRLLMTVPFVWDEHEQPRDFARYSSYGLNSLLVKHGFTVIQVRRSCPDIRVIFQLINAYLYKKTVTSDPGINLIITLILMAPWNIIGSLLFRLLPENMDLYLDTIVLAKKEKVL